MDANKNRGPIPEQFDSIEAAADFWDTHNLTDYEDQIHEIEIEVRAQLREHKNTSALEARRTADRAVFGDLVGCALSSGEPEWVSDPEPHWRVPYRSFDGTLVATVEVDARTWVVSLTSEERAEILEQVERLTVNNVPA